MTDRPADRQPPLHPGEVLSEEFLKLLGITPYRLAKDIDVPLTRITAILAGRGAITADTALRLARYFGNSAAFWLGLQSLYELHVAQDQAETLAGLERIQPLPRPDLKEPVLT